CVRVAVPLLTGREITFLLQPLQQWIQVSGTDAIPMARELFDHTEGEDRLLRGVMEYLQPDQSGIQVTVIYIEVRCRPSISKLADTLCCLPVNYSAACQGCMSAARSTGRPST